MSLLQKMISTDTAMQPPVIVVYGTPGIGKTTFATSAPEPLVIDLEGGAKYFDVPKAHPDNHKQLIELLDALIKEDHQFKTIVLDSLDWAEKFAIDELLTSTGAKSYMDKTNPATSYGQGKPTVVAKLQTILEKLQKLHRQKQCTIIITAHTKVTSNDDPVDGSYQQHTLKTMIAESGALFIEWADAVLFMRRKMIKSPNTASGFIEGDRVIVTSNKIGTTSKNRLHLPEEIPATWESFISSINTNK
jgi:hypothetical protein